VTTSPTQVPPDGPLADPEARRREHRSWYAYDWATSAFNTSVITVFAGPYLTGLARAGSNDDGFVSLLGIPVRDNSWFLFVVSASVLLQVLVLPVVGAIADRSTNKPRMLGRLALAGSVATVALFATTGGAWLAAGLLLLVGNVLFGAAAVVYDSFLPEIATADERDAVSSRGWAFGYAGGGLLLLGHLALFLSAESLGIDDGLAARLALATAGLWWAGFSVITVRGVRARTPLLAEGEGGIADSFRQLRTTLRELRSTPLTLRFLVGYLLYNDGVQTVIAAAAVFGADELLLEQDVLIGAILAVQFVAFFGALALGRVARFAGAKRTVLGSLVVWSLVVGLGRGVPAEDPLAFLLLSVAIGFVLGGTQALSRSMFSQLVPPDREAEYFAIYQISDRGTSWIGTFTLGLAVQITGTYRSGILVLLAFFVVGGLVLAATPMRRAIEESGNPVPEKV